MDDETYVRRRRWSTEEKRAVVAFTDFGVENLLNLIDIHRNRTK